MENACVNRRGKEVSFREAIERDAGGERRTRERERGMDGTGCAGPELKNWLLRPRPVPRAGFLFTPLPAARGRSRELLFYNGTPGAAVFSCGIRDSGRRRQ